MAKYDVIIIGGGHAGCEAAYASAKRGAKTLLLTTSLDTIGLLAGSPEIHFAGKLMSERLRYHRLLKSGLEKVDSLRIKQDIVETLILKKLEWHVKTVTGQEFVSKSTVVAVGTFLKGRSRLGGHVQKSGRNSEVSSERLAENLKELGFLFKTSKVMAAPVVKLQNPKKKIQDVVLQPESTEQQEWYLKGKEMDVSEDAQQEIVNSITGLEEAEITRFGYSVTYSCLKDGQLNINLESKKHPSLFFAGQVAGSNGHEEAAASGLQAGTNAARLVVSREKEGQINV